jgi:hypothetical protein
LNPRDRLLGLTDEALLAECEVDRYRASGPGGQKRNKTDSAVRVRHRATGVQAHAAESRSQHENRAVALQRLRVRLALDLREHVDPDGYPPESDLVRWLHGPVRTTRREREEGAYLRAIGALIDVVAAAEGVIADVAAALGVSTNLLSKRIASDEAVARKINEVRAQFDLRPLR